MIICPDCRSHIQYLSSCSNCEWYLEYVEDIPQYLASKRSILIDDYIKCYKQISIDDLKSTILLFSHLKYQAEKLTKYLPKSKDAQICELGVGQGMLAKHIKKNGFSNVTIVDIAVPYLKRLAGDFKAIIADAENLPFQEEFDYIFSVDVMEHVINVGSFLFSVNRALNKEGLFIFRVPDTENLMQYTPHLGCRYDFVHLRSFNSDLVKKLLQDAGFEILKLHYDNYWTYAYNNLVKKVRIFNYMYSKLYPKITNEGFVRDDNWMKKIFCRMFLKPLEIVCVAKKKNAL